MSQPDVRFELEVGAHAKVAERAAARIRSQILAQRMEPGTHLGTLTELTDSMGISRGSAREAMALLEHQGLISIKPGPSGGVFVARPDSTRVVTSASNLLHFAGAGASELHNARLLLEPELARLAASKPDTDEVSSFLAKTLDVERESKSEPAAYNRASMGFHLVVARCAENVVLSLLLEVILDFRVFDGAYYLFDEHAIADNHEEHSAIADAVSKGDAELAGSLMHAHIKRVHPSSGPPPRS